MATSHPQSTSEETSPRPPSAVSRGLPPTYEQALQHRRIEHSAYHTPPGYPPDGAYPGPPRTRPTRSGRTRWFQRPSAFSRSVSPVVVVPDPEIVSVASTTSPEEHPCMTMALPPMHICMAVTCLVFDIITPGIGTILSGFGVFCCTRSADWPVRKKFVGFGMCLFMGVAQLILTPILLIGWIWSVMWGFALLGQSLNNYHAAKDTDDEEEDEEECSRPTSPATEGATSRQPSTSSLSQSVTSCEGTPRDSPQEISTRESQPNASSNNRLVIQTDAEVHVPNGCEATVENADSSVEQQQQNQVTNGATNVPELAADVTTESSRRLSTGHMTNLPSDPPPYVENASRNGGHLTDVV